MIKFLGETNQTTDLIKHYYNVALEKNEQYADACCISTISNNRNPDSRFVNIKYIKDNQLIFFTNYNSKKSIQIALNKSASLVFFWKEINVQIRMQGEISMTSEEFSDRHFQQRSFDKNVAAIISEQSKTAKSYDQIVESYNTAKKYYADKPIKRPKYWGGFEFNYKNFELWKGNDSRLNERYFYEKIGKNWECETLQP